MKKILLGLCAAVFLCTGAFAQELAVTNTLGGNSDNLDGNDLVYFYLNGSSSSTYVPAFTIADRFQVDFSWEWFTARGRLDAYLTGSTLSGFQLSDKGIRFNGFARAQPLQQIGIIAGNSFFGQLEMNCGQLYALDDTPSYGKLMKDGLGLCSTIPLGDSKIKISMAGGMEFDSFKTTPSSWIYSGGVEIYKNKLFSAGATARDFTSGKFGKYAVLGGFYPGNFVVNAGFIYNNTADDCLPCESKYSVSLSGGYKNKDLGLKVYADVMSGLTNEYIAANSQETKLYNGYLPFMAAFRGIYTVSDQLETGLNVKFTKLMYKSGSSCVTIYPNAEYEFNDMLSLTGGLRLTLNTAYDQVVSGYAIPLNFKLKWKTSF